MQLSAQGGRNVVFELDDSSIHIPLDAVLQRCSIPVNLPIQLKGFDPNVGRRLVEYVKTGRIDYKGLSLNDLGHLTYLASAMGARKVVSDVQHSIDNHEPLPTEQKELTEIINMASMIPSLNYTKLLEKVNPVSLIMGIHLWRIENASVMIEIIKMNPSLNLADEMQIELYERNLLVNVFYWAYAHEISQHAFHNVLEALDIRYVIPRVNPKDPMGLRYIDSHFNEICKEYKTMKSKEKMYNVWVSWLIRQDMKNSNGRRANEGNSRLARRGIPDCLFAQSSASSVPLRDSDSMRLATETFPSAVASPVSPERLALEPVRNRKIDLLKKAMKQPFLRMNSAVKQSFNNLKAKFERRNA